ncbi:hypothetical protein ABU162_04925 [Paenibacillus thiaminolyticus]|uniref:hypothetical protein n=1 Tax=Paenibacillus thiaminolyticus TaxID=49283 RepID=UPI0035A61BD1
MRLKIILMCVLLFTIPITPAFAKITPSQVLFEAAEIKNVDTLIMRAKNGVSDIPHATVTLDAVVTKVKGSSIIEEKIETYSTTQKIKAVRSTSGALTESYVTTRVALIASDGNQYKSDNDASLGVKAYSTVYWDYVTINNQSYIKHAGASGGWQINDSQLRVTNQLVKLGATGEGENGKLTTQIKEYHPSSFTFSYSPPSNWRPIKKDVFESIGVNTSCTISDYSESWSLTLNNKRV